MKIRQLRLTIEPCGLYGDGWATVRIELEIPSAPWKVTYEKALQESDIESVFDRFMEEATRSIKSHCMQGIER